MYIICFFTLFSFTVNKKYCLLTLIHLTISVAEWLEHQFSWLRFPVESNFTTRVWVYEVPRLFSISVTLALIAYGSEPRIWSCLMFIIYLFANITLYVYVVIGTYRTVGTISTINMNIPFVLYVLPLGWEVWDCPPRWLYTY